MNFIQPDFWRDLLVVLLPCLFVRFVGQRSRIWQTYWDAIALLGISLLLLGKASWISLVVLLVEAGITFWAVRHIQGTAHQSRRWVGVGAIALNLLLLAYFKYFQGVFSQAFTESGTSFTSGALPLGISFYTFQNIGLIADTLRNQVKQPIQPIDYFNFTSFFPKLASGPIERWETLSPQLHQFQLQFSRHHVEIGLRWFSLGLFMKLAIADNLATYTRFAISDTGNAWEIWLFAILYGLQLYFDFAGYSFLALGLARMLGIELSINFLAPYTALNIQDFWRRWNVTLMTWFRDYLYFVLGGGKVPWTALNILAVFVASGIWHGSSWNFVAWGLYHGGLMLIYRYGGKRLKLPDSLSWLLTFASVMAGWLLFTEQNLTRLGLEFRALFTPSAYQFENLHYALSVLSTGTPVVLLLTVLPALVMVITEAIAAQKNSDSPYAPFLHPWAARILLGLTIILAPRATSSFIYFSF